MEKYSYSLCSCRQRWKQIHLHLLLYIYTNIYIKAHAQMRLPMAAVKPSYGASIDVPVNTL